MPIPLKVKSIGALKHKLGNFALTIIYISDIDKKVCGIYVSFNWKLHQVDRLKANILVSNNMLCTEGFAINLSIFFALIHNCSVKIDISTRQHFKFLRHKTLVSASIIMPLCSKVPIAFQHIKFSDIHNFLFYPSLQ